MKIYIDDLKNKTLADTEYIEVNLEEVAERVKSEMPYFYFGFNAKGSQYAEDLLNSTVRVFKNELHGQIRNEIKLNNSDKLIISMMGFVVRISEKENPTDVELQTMARIAERLFDLMKKE